MEPKDFNQNPSFVKQTPTEEQKFPMETVPVSQEQKAMREYFKQKYMKRRQNPEFMEKMRLNSAKYYALKKEQLAKEREQNGLVVKRGRPAKYV